GWVEGVLEGGGIELGVLPGEEEARLAYLGATASLGLEAASLAVFDTGGGSTQFTFGDGRRVDEQFSIPLGAVRVTEQFGLDRAVSTETVRAARAAIDGELGVLDGHARPDAVIGLGGALTNMAAVEHRLVSYDPDVVHGTLLDSAEIERQIELYRERGAAERRGIPGLQPKRAEVILA